MSVEEGEWIIERLWDLADDAVPLAVEMLASPDEDTRNVAIALLRELDDPRADEPLKRLLYKSDYSDEEKLKALQALVELGSPVDEGVIVEHLLLPDMTDRSFLNAIGRYL